MLNKVNMKRLVIILLITALGSLAIAGTIFAVKGPNKIFTADENIIDEQKTFSMDGIKNISIHTVSTDVNIIPSDSNEIKACFHGSVTATKGNVPNMQAELNGDTVNISIEQKFKFFIGINYHIGKEKLDVYIPKTYANSVKSRTTSGDINVKDLTIEKFNFNSVSGELYASSLYTKDTSLGTTSGDIKLENFKGNLNHKSVSGGIKVQYETFDNNVSIHSTSGDVILSIPENSQFNVAFNSTSGDFTNKYGSLESSLNNKHGISASTGNSSNKISVSTVSGDFKLTP